MYFDLNGLFILLPLVTSSHTSSIIIPPPKALQWMLPYHIRILLNTYLMQQKEELGLCSFNSDNRIRLNTKRCIFFLQESYCALHFTLYFTATPENDHISSVLGNLCNGVETISAQMLIRLFRNPRRLYPGRQTSAVKFQLLGKAVTSLSSSPLVSVCSHPSRCFVPFTG